MLGLGDVAGQILQGFWDPKTLLHQSAKGGVIGLEDVEVAEQNVMVAPRVGALGAIVNRLRLTTPFSNWRM